MLHYIFTLFFILFFNINIEAHTQAHFEHKKDLQPKEIPKLEEFTNTAHTPPPNIQDLIPNKTVFPEAPKLDNKPPIFVKNPHTGKIEPCIFVAHDEEELKKKISEKYGPLTEEQYQLILAALAPVILIPGIGGVVGGGTAVGGTIGGIIGGIVTGPAIPVITIGIGIGILIKWRKDQKAKNNAYNNNDKNGDSNNSGNSGNNNNDKDPKDKKDKTPKPFVKKHPERTYEPNPKHNKNSPNGIGKPSKNPEKMVDEALNVQGKDYLVGIEDDHFVVCPEHRPGKYHAYIVETFEELRPPAQNALKNAGLVDPKTNKIIKKK
ncbi:MAG: hypothetical protein M1365_00110 [Actinobacteria bacterium]|nr:hypothetical protein [Actinomycetota bacterium]